MKIAGRLWVAAVATSTPTLVTVGPVFLPPRSPLCFSEM